MSLTELNINVSKLLFWEGGNYCFGRGETTVLGGGKLLFWEGGNYCFGRGETTVLGGGGKKKRVRF